MARILCVDDEPDIRRTLAKVLTRGGHEPADAGSVIEALRAVDREHVDLIISDWQMPGLDGMDLLALLREKGHDIPVVMLTAHGTIQHAVAALRAGAANYLTKPFEPEQIGLTVEQTLGVARLRAENDRLRRDVRAYRSGQALIGRSAAMQGLLQSVSAAATSRATVLLQGESGTGKELLARAIHEQSDRRDGPFVRINCAAMPEGLVESTLFGHEKGAFTGALKRVLGAFERADGGTLLLDEVSEMRLDLQPKLLRVLQEREFERIGGGAPIRVDVRVVATTNRHLATEAAAGRFRQDLYYRLSVFPMLVPSLRERREDIPLLAHHFAQRAAEEAHKTIDGFAPDGMELLCAHDWPGNVRELQHAVERAVILAHAPLLEARLFAPTAGAATQGTRGPSAAPGADDGVALMLHSLDLADVERRVMEHALAITDGNRTHAAALLGVNVRTLRRKLNEPAAAD